jgi:hypothetical protein
MSLPKMSEKLATFARNHLHVIVNSAIILAVTTIVFRNWIFSPQWPASGDIMGYISREYLYWRDYRWLLVWRPNSFGYPEGIDLKDFFFMLLRFVSGNAANTAKVFGILSFALAGFAMYAFGYHCTKKNLAALAGSLVYLLNGQFLTQLTEAHLDIMFSYAVIPFIFLFLDRALETGNIKDIIASSILIGVMLTGFEPEMLYIYGVFLGLFVIINLLRPQKSMRFRESIKLRLKALISIAVLATIISACFWIPFLFNVKAAYLSPTYSRGTLEDAYASGYTNFAEAFTLTGKEAWGYINVVDVTKGVSLQILPVPTILLLVFAFAYIITLVLKLNRYSFFFGLSALISIILAMGPHSFESCFLWAWSNVPYFQAFRAISRWDLMTAFSNAFFMCVSASILTGYLLKIAHGPKHEFEVGMNFRNGLQESRNLKVSLPSFNSISHSARRFLYYFAIFALIAILMSGFISTWFLFSNGLQVYTPPSDYFQPYEYLNNVTGDYKVVNVGRSPGEWYVASGQDTDFVGVDMLTPIGWSHDLGYESTFIDNKPTLQDGGLLPLSTDFVNYLRFYLFRNNVTRNMLKLLGAFDYKYVVIPSYTPETTRDFFLSQYGARLIYNESNSIILENEFYTPSVFGSVQSALVFGGPESLSSLCDFSSFELNKTAIILANQADNFSAIVGNHLDNISTVVFADSDVLDSILVPSNDVHLIYLANYGIRSSDLAKYWVQNEWWTDEGALVLGGTVLTTTGNNEINIPFGLNTEGDYDIFIRVAFAPSRGKLLVSIDGLPIADVYPSSNFLSGLQWINLTSNFPLQAGSHLITLLNDGTGANDLDAIAIVEHSKLISQTEETINAFQRFTGKILYVIGAAKAFSKTLPPGWSILTIPGEGYALQMEDSVNIAAQGLASASSVESSAFAPQYAIDGNPSTRWASAVGVPQWLEVTFPAPREIDGVEINFEASYGKDYRIQTWNGTGWVDQIAVENNSLLDRQHMFTQPVTTEKLRVLVTAAPMNNVVSIRELEILSDTSAPSSQIFVPRSGEYDFAARLFPEGTNGTLYLKVDEKLFSVSCSANLSAATWFELGSAPLSVGEHNITAFASGNVTLDEIGVYSASSNVPTIDDVFNSSLSAPSVTYEEVNPCRYIVHVNCTNPFLLVFSESYHPSWKAYIDSQEVSPVIVDSLVNGFFINRTGNFDVTLYFTGQDIVNIGLIISFGGIILVIALVLATSAPGRKVRHLMNRKLLKRS